MSVEWTDGVRQRHGPSWRELVDQAAKELGWDNPDLLRARGTDLQILEYFKLKQHGHTEKLVAWLTTSLQPPNDALSGAAILRELVALDRCGIFYTTNYDDFLERAFELLGRHVKVIAIEPDMASEGVPTEVVKFHGDLNHINTMVLSEKDYQRRLKLDDAMDFRLRADVLGRVLLFLGYSFRDYNVSYLFQLVVDKFGNYPGPSEAPRAYIAIPDPSAFEFDLFASRRMEVIPIDGYNMTTDTASLLAQMRGA
jgi:hypothetical protein